MGNSFFILSEYASMPNSLDLFSSLMPKYCSYILAASGGYAKTATDLFPREVKKSKSLFFQIQQIFIR